MDNLKDRMSDLTPERRELLKRLMAARGKTVSTPMKQEAAKPKVAKSMDFSLYFFSADGTTDQTNKYQLLLDSARYADAHDFHAIWTPERHFQDFGGLFPNPSVLAAGIATITKQLRIRAGSVVLPLHSPVRVTEEWSVVDNLSGGRVGLSTATGWHAHDYVIRPDGFENRREIMFENIPTIRQLWRGEKVPFPGPNGEMIEVRSLPRPVQDDLPIWVTASSPKTWERAASLGCNIFTSLIGYSMDQLAGLIKDYRSNLAAAGFDPRKGKVTLMMHTHLGEDLEEIKERVREPMKGYLVHFFEQLQPLLGPEFAETQKNDQDAQLDFAFERYFQSASLLGTVDKCKPIVANLAELGVNELACLVDFGLSDQVVLDSLKHLNELRVAFSKEAEKQQLAGVSP